MSRAPALADPFHRHGYGYLAVVGVGRDEGRELDGDKNPDEAMELALY